MDVTHDATSMIRHATVLERARALRAIAAWARGSEPKQASRGIILKGSRGRRETGLQDDALTVDLLLKDPSWPVALGSILARRPHGGREVTETDTSQQREVRSAFIESLALALAEGE